jgi:GT2 family glycosyltransferase
MTKAEPPAVSIAVLLATYNRRAVSEACLRALFAQRYRTPVQITTYLTDSSSPDGTAAFVRAEFPDVVVLDAPDTVFWAGGMRIAWAASQAVRYDYLLLMNDDTRLYPTAVQTLLDADAAARARSGHAGLIAGSTRDPDSGARTYGGLLQYRGDVMPSDEIQKCDQFNCNATLIPADVADVVGQFDPVFTHALADHDYSLRARRLGFQAWVAPGFVGECRANPTAAWADPSVPVWRRLKALHSPKGLPPHEWIAFCRRHLPYQWPLRLALLYVHAVIPQLWVTRDQARRPLAAQTNG